MIRMTLFKPLALLIAFTALLLVPPSGYALINNNGTGGAYDEPGSGSSEIGFQSIEELVIAGAGSFFRSDRDIRHLMEIFELQDVNPVDFDQFRGFVQSALGNITEASTTYDTLIGRAEVTPYRKDMIEKLKVFDYNAFQLKNNLAPGIYQVISSYLTEGDVTAIFRETRTRFDRIRQLLEIFGNDASENRLPDVSVVRILNEECSMLNLFGSYVARIFDAISR